ncbi:MAG: TlyA family RNA methyltransferase [Thermotogota bacterium]
MLKIRLDKYLSINQLVESREKSRRLIKDGKVLVDGKKINKPSFIVKNDSKIDVLENYKYVGRGAFKLLKAIDDFDIDLNEKICMDIGSSTGGFSQVLLENNVKKIYAIDVGSEQLHSKLRKEDKIILKENTNARDFRNEEKVDFICCDVSFISITKLINTFFNNLKEKGDLIALIKPQFEVGSSNINNGIVTNNKILHNSLKNVLEEFESYGFKVLKVIESPIKGTKGNKEFLAHIVKY